MNGKDMIHDRQWGIVIIAMEQLDWIFQVGIHFPPGYKVLQAQDDFLSSSFRLLVEGPDLPVSPEGTALPELSTVSEATGRIRVISWEEMSNPSSAQENAQW